MLYFAYGSNMNGARMVARVPEARFVATGRLHGYGLRERLYADIERCDGEYTDGVIYDIGARGLEKLDRYEGYPNVYTGGMAKVYAPKRKRPLECWVYFMTEATARARARLPYSIEYAAICASGAREHGVTDSHFAPRLCAMLNAPIDKRGKWTGRD